MLDVTMIERGLEKPGKTKGGLATAMGVRPGAVSEILSGIRLIKASEITPIIDYLELNSVPIMGRVGAGAAIEPEHEQVPRKVWAKSGCRFRFQKKPSPLK
jgi:repressor LexA